MISRPNPFKPDGETLVGNKLFEVQKWNLESLREIVPLGQFAIVFCLSGMLRCGGTDFSPGEFFLLPASMFDRTIRPKGERTSLLRITIPLLNFCTR